jgi:tetratricopeptide (TPR) repeat protein
MSPRLRTTILVFLLGTASPRGVAQHADDLPPINREHLAADQFVKALVTRLRLQASPTVDDFIQAAAGLRIARRLRPDDEELLRHEIQAWMSAGDDAKVFEGTEQLVRLNPLDTVAQLRLVTSRLRKLQDAPSRLAAYDRLTGDSGRVLDASIRSRLLLDAALLAREMGDEAGFVDRLTQATTLDATNKDAAALYSTYFLDRTDDPLERADLLANVVLADPNDMNAHTNLARELFRQGAYKATRRFMSRAGDIAMSGAIEPGISDLFDRYLLVWMTEGDSEASAAIRLLENRGLSTIREQRKRAERQGIDVGEEPESLVPQEIELTRLALAWTRGDEPAMAESARKVNARLDNQLSFMDKRQAPFDTLSPDEDLFLRAEVKLQRASARLWAATHLDECRNDLDALTSPTAANRLDEVAANRLLGWMSLARARAAFRLASTPGPWSPSPLAAFAQREFRRAAPLLDAAGNDPMARLGLGILAEEQGHRPLALKTYAALAIDHANTLVGCAAKKRVEAILGKPLAPTPTVRALEEWSESLAPWLDEITTNPSAFMTLVCQPLKPRIDVFERQELRLTLKNVSRLPMSVGPDLAFNSRLMLSPRVIAKAIDVSSWIEPEPVEFDRRLRLMPGESVDAVIWGSRGSLGIWLDRFADQTVTIRWRAIQGYRVDHQKRFAPGIISVTALSDLIERTAIVPRDDPAEIMQRLQTATGRDFLEETLRAVITAGSKHAAESDEQVRIRRGEIATALAARFPTLTPMERVFAISSAARVQMLNESRAILDAAQDDPSPFVQAALIVDGYLEPDEPGLLRICEDPDPDLRAMARAARRRLTGSVHQPTAIPESPLLPPPTESPAAQAPAP